MLHHACWAFLMLACRQIVVAGLSSSLTCLSLHGEKTRSIVSVIPTCYDFAVCNAAGAECVVVGGSSPLVDVFINFGSRTFSLNTGM